MSHNPIMRSVWKLGVHNLRSFSRDLEIERRQESAARRAIRIFAGLADLTTRGDSSALIDRWRCGWFRNRAFTTYSIDRNGERYKDYWYRVCSTMFSHNIVLWVLLLQLAVSQIRPGTCFSWTNLGIETSTTRRKHIATEWVTRSPWRRTPSFLALSVKHSIPTRRRRTQGSMSGLSTRTTTFCRPMTPENNNEDLETPRIHAPIENDTSTKTSLQQKQSLQRLYSDAARIRRLYGHGAAQPLYQAILNQQVRATNETDASTATRIAALSDVKRLSHVFDLSANDAIPFQQRKPRHQLLRQLRQSLARANYTTAAIRDMVGIASAQQGPFYATCPIYLSTVSSSARWSGRQRAPPLVETPVQCLVSLLLLGWSLPQSLVQSVLGDVLFHVLHDLQLLELSPVDDSCFALVSIFPLTVTNNHNNNTGAHDTKSFAGSSHTTTTSSTTTTLWIATDWHPNVLGTTRPFDPPVETDDNNEPGKVAATPTTQTREPVYYIGPDSLAMVQLALPPMIQSLNVSAGASSTTADDDDHLWVMDVCTGSGIQALVSTHLVQQRLKDMAAASSEQAQPCRRLLHVSTMDLNPRALECTLWNFCLNGFLEEKEKDNSRTTPSMVLHQIQGNVCQPQSSFHLQSFGSSSSVADPGGWKHFATLSALMDHLSPSPVPLTALVANPPFVPSPPRPPLETATTPPSSSSSYGLFSTYIPSQTESSINTTNTRRESGGGGSTGDEVWTAIVDHLVQPYLRPTGRVAIVSEFFWSQYPTERLEQLCQTHREQNILSTSTATNTRTTSIKTLNLLLVTNQYPLDCLTYAQRRCFGKDRVSSSTPDVEEWRAFLTHQLGYTAMSPGFLLVDRNNNNTFRNEHDKDHTTSIHHAIMPRSKYGSLWTPSNPIAMERMASILQEYLKW